MPFALRAGGIGAVTAEEDADVHLVGLGFEPAEVAFDAVPGAGPLMFFVDAVVRVAVDDPVLDGLRELLEGNLRGNVARPAEGEQVSL